VNYRHAYHAGNWADCMKHAVLVWLLRALAQKQKPFFVLDTHAGQGQYDLESEEACRTGEAETGIRRLISAPHSAVADYLGLVRQLGLYPGSPALIRAMLRPGDRLACCELHPEEHAALRSLFVRDRQVQVHLRDGFGALLALLPPVERRGLVFIDPPYEASDEHLQVAVGLATANSRFPGGVLAAWYPIKHRARVRTMQATIRDVGIRDVVAAEFMLRAPLDAARLNGCGLIVVNPPWGFETEVPVLLTALLQRLGNSEPGAEVGVVRLAHE
jgi:23S rRNA (adenine2030-N6)-methyltransferase